MEGEDLDQAYGLESSNAAPNTDPAFQQRIIEHVHRKKKTYEAAIRDMLHRCQQHHCLGRYGLSTDENGDEGLVTRELAGENAWQQRPNVLNFGVDEAYAEHLEAMNEAVEKYGIERDALMLEDGHLRAKINDDEVAWSHQYHANYQMTAEWRERDLPEAGELKTDDIPSLDHRHYLKFAIDGAKSVAPSDGLTGICERNGPDPEDVKPMHDLDRNVFGRALQRLSDEARCERLERYLARVETDDPASRIHNAEIEQEKQIVEHIRMNTRKDSEHVSVQANGGLHNPQPDVNGNDAVDQPLPTPEFSILLDFPDPEAAGEKPQGDQNWDIGVTTDNTMQFYEPYLLRWSYESISVPRAEKIGIDISKFESCNSQSTRLKRKQPESDGGVIKRTKGSLQAQAQEDAGLQGRI